MVLCSASSTKRELRRFHVVVVQRRQRNVQKIVMHVQSCCFAYLNLLLFSSPRCRRRRCCSSSLLHLSVVETVENQSWHWALRSDKGIHCIGINLNWFPQTSLLHFNLGQVPFEFCSKAKRIAIFSEMVLRDQVLNISPWGRSSPPDRGGKYYQWFSDSPTCVDGKKCMIAVSLW